VARFDIAIRGGILVDGRRMPRVRADVGIKDGKIAEIGSLRASDADQPVLCQITLDRLLPKLRFVYEF
jgi:N-acyl-D-amino-acid deacylase